MFLLTEAEEDSNADGEGPKPKPVKPKRIVKNPQPKLSFESLQGPKGLKALNKAFEKFKFKGNGREKEDLTEVMKLLEQWLYRLFPKFHFEDGLQRVESLGKKKIVQTYLKKLRLDMDVDHAILSDGENDDKEQDEGERTQMDAFDTLLSQEIERNATQTPMEVESSTPVLTDEQRRRIEEKRQEALNRKLARMQATNVDTTGDSSTMSESTTVYD